MGDRLDLTKPVRTRYGASVKILSTEGREPYPVVGYIADMDIVSQWTVDGLFSVGEEGLSVVGNRKDYRDLVNVPSRLLVVPMREKMARALAPRAWSSELTGSAVAAAARRKASLRHVDAILDAMLEPNEGVLLVGAEGHGLSHPPLGLWRDMIDAIKAGK